jgi:RNA polymerase sigma factor (sigma-70 family)
LSRGWDMSPENKMDDASTNSPLDFSDWSAPGEFERLIGEVREGSQDAAWDLLERVGPHVQRVVHKMLNRELRSKFDSVDFVQAVWASFFINRQKIAEFTEPSQLIRFLVGMARNKVISEHRRRILTEKYDVRRERPDAMANPAIEETQVYPAPSPSQFAIARECWHQLIDGQPEMYRQIVVRKYMGESHDEIAMALRINRRTITRILDRLLPKESA